jgi:predicted metal-binding membrane protein
MGKLIVSSARPFGASEATHDRGFYALSAGAFLSSVVATIGLCRSMSGGMKMPGQSWSGASWMFTQMWFVMMVAMVTPSLVPMLTKYRQALRRQADSPVTVATLRATIAYLAVWQAVRRRAALAARSLRTVSTARPSTSNITT